jgi:hypothetical protein
MGKKTGSGMNNPDHISVSLETTLRLKYLNSLMRIRDTAFEIDKIWIRDPGCKKYIPDPQHCLLSVPMVSDLLSGLLL